MIYVKQYRVLSTILDGDRILLCWILELLWETILDEIIRCGRLISDWSMLFRLISRRSGFKCYQTLSEKANHGRIGASEASVEARDWLFQIGPGVASA